MTDIKIIQICFGTKPQTSELNSLSTDNFNILKGAGQKFILSPMHSNLSVKKYKVRQNPKTHLRYAEDTVIQTESIENLLSSYIKSKKKHGPHIHINKKIWSTCDNSILSWGTLETTVFGELLDNEDKEIRLTFLPLLDYWYSLVNEHIIFLNPLNRNFEISLQYPGFQSRYQCFILPFSFI